MMPVESYAKDTWNKEHDWHEMNRIFLVCLKYSPDFGRIKQLETIGANNKEEYVSILRVESLHHLFPLGLEYVFYG